MAKHPHPPATLAQAVLASLLLTITASFAHAQAKPSAPKPAPDVIIFTNGDQLSGTLERAVGDSIVFKSDMTGEFTVSLDKVKELHSSGSFAVLRKDVIPSRRNVTPGTILYTDGKLTVAPPTAVPEVVPETQIAYIIDQPTYDKELEKKPGPLYGWNGTINGGSTIIRSTDDGSTFTAGIGLNRLIPAVPYLPARNRTGFNLQETYGKLTTPVIPQTTPPTPPSVARTNIFHSDLERDQFFSSNFYALAQTSFDHNYSQGLNLQQIYGAGIGWSAFKNPKHQLDLKATLQYEKQSFETPASNENLIGSTFSETYHRNLPHKLIFSESLSVLPSWNELHAYSANGSVRLLMPVFKRLGLSLMSTDNFLNNPAVGFKKNSFQFVTAISYSLK